MTPDESFASLLTDFLEGDLTPEGFAELQALLAEHPHLRTRAADLLQTHRLLGFAMQEGAAGRDSFIHTTLARLPQSAESFVGGVMQRTVPAKRWWREWRPLAAAAALVLLASGLAFAGWWRSGVEVMRVSADVLPGWQAGDRIRSKDLKLVRGEVRLRLASGVVLDVAGPVDLRFVDAMHLWLDAGRVTADVGETGKGFVIQTPQSRVLDLGTRFEVNVLDAAHTNVEVLTGKVELFEKAKAERTALLAAGDTVRMNEAGQLAHLKTAQPDWALGPFHRPPDALPLIAADDEPVFQCPLRKAPVRWEASRTFHPAAVIKDGKVYLFYRAMEARSGEGRLTSRIGLAVSEDGFNFEKRPEPVLFPAEDDEQQREWEGGCEDPRVVETEDGSYLMFYTQYAPAAGPAANRLATATSKDLLHWTKRGPLVPRGAGQQSIPSKSASLVCQLVDGRLVAARINGRYWLYCGRGTIRLMSSADLVTWDLLPGPVLESGPARAGKFDSGYVEAGPPALLTERGIVLLYNGKNGETALSDMDLPAAAHSCGQALFSPSDPGKLLGRTDTPFLKPELSWERHLLFRADSTYGEGLVLLQGRWFLYYGSADTFVGVATADAAGEQATLAKVPSLPPQQ